MADISKCKNNECKKQETCYRFTAPESYWQSYSDFRPDENGECKHYWENTNVKR